MGRFGGLPARHRFQRWLVNLCATLLTGLAVVSLAQPSVAGAVANPASFAPTRHTPTPTATAPPKPTATPTPKPTTTPTTQPTATPRPTATPHPSPTAEPTPAPTSVLSPVGTTTATPTPHTGATTGGDTADRGSTGSPGSPWLVEGLVIVLLLLLGFSLLLVLIAVRSARIKRRNRPAFSPTPVPADGQVARLNQSLLERKQPLSPAQVRALRKAAQESADVSQQSTASLAAVRLDDGVPSSLPMTEAETIPHLPTPPRPMVRRSIEDRTHEGVGEGQGY